VKGFMARDDCERNPHPALSLEKGDATGALNNGFAVNTESTNSRTTALLAAKCRMLFVNER